MLLLLCCRSGSGRQRGGEGTTSAPAVVGATPRPALRDTRPMVHSPSKGGVSLAPPVDSAWRLQCPGKLWAVWGLSILPAARSVVVSGRGGRGARLGTPL